MGDAGRVLIIPKGEYNSQTGYEMLDLVYYQGTSYVAKKTTLGHLPTETEYWQIFASSGSVRVTGRLAAGETQVVFENMGSYSNAAFLILTSMPGLEYNSVSYNNNAITVTFDAQSSAVDVQLVFIN